MASTPAEAVSLYISTAREGVGMLWPFRVRDIDAEFEERSEATP